MRFSNLTSTAAVGLTIVWLSGCACAPSPTASSAGNSTTADTSHEGHNHAALGPNGGHLLELGEEKFHAEWLHDDDAGKLTIFILDGTAKELVPISAEKLTIDKKVGERADKFELTAVDRQGEMPKSAKFELVDKSLIEALKLVGDGVEASLTVDVNGQPFTVPFTKHE